MGIDHGIIDILGLWRNGIFLSVLIGKAPPYQSNCDFQFSKYMPHTTESGKIKYGNRSVQTPSSLIN